MTEEIGADRLWPRKCKTLPEISIAESILGKLKRGETVVLVVDDSYLPKKRRVDKPRLFIVPFTAMGLGISSQVLLSLEAYGSEVVDAVDEVKPMVFIRMGIKASLAKALSSELNQVFKKGVKHGSKN